MKIFDCFMYFDEETVLDIRLNFLEKHVDKFIIIESRYNHKGEKREPHFDINKFKKFKDKILYFLVDEEPNNIKSVDKNFTDKKKSGRLIMNALRRENFQRDYIAKCITEAKDDDWIIISDLDEIPDLKNYDLKKSKHSLVFFKQLMIYYKFNLLLENFTWIGSKACKKKQLKSPQWLRNIKDRSYPWWRVDTLFSNHKYTKIDIIENGGWHFSYIKTAADIEKKLQSYLHHREYDLNPLGIKNIQDMISNKKVIYDLKVDSKFDKFSGRNQLKKIDLNLLPSYISENKNKFINWIEE